MYASYHHISLISLFLTVYTYIKCSGLILSKCNYADAELKKYTRQVDDIDSRVGDLEKLVKELDEWCSELGRHGSGYYYMHLKHFLY